MREILPPTMSSQKLCSRVTAQEGKYRLALQCLQVPCEEGMLFYQCFTGEVLLLTPKEILEIKTFAEQEESSLRKPEVFPSQEENLKMADAFAGQGGMDGEELRKKLIEKHFLVPETFDEYEEACNFRRLAEILTPKTEEITEFTVFSTTDCNARCAYCYELGRPRRPMSDETARDAAAFIARVSGGKEVTLTWFGGEPLYNRRAIDVLTNELKSRGVAFRSKMVTNGFLFDEETVRTANAVWKLERVQITLDGTEEAYNRIKAYVGFWNTGSARDSGDSPAFGSGIQNMPDSPEQVPSGRNDRRDLRKNQETEKDNCTAKTMDAEEKSPYRRVLRNIELLLGAGINVDIRLNMNLQNVEDLSKLVDELSERFRGEKLLRVYSVALRDFREDDAEAEEIYAWDRLQRKILSSPIEGIRHLSRKYEAYGCMADHDGSLVILPDGQLGKCEHESENPLVGNIYEGITNPETVRLWKERVEVPECRSCAFASNCIRLRKCAWVSGKCTDEDRRRIRLSVEQMVLGEYRRRKMCFH